MSARTAALPLPWPARSRPRPAGSVLRFTEPGGPLVAVCGLHGGAGTTTLACLFAEHAAAASPPGRVLAAEADPRAAELARRLGAASPVGLAELAALRAGDGGPERAPVAQREDGLRVLAASQPARAEASPSALAALLAEARTVHALCVLDAGSLRQPAVESALAGADVVVWTTDPARLDPAAFASPLVRPARGARWVLALAPVSGGGRARRSVPRGLRQDVAAVVTVARGTPSGDAARDAAERVARAVRG